MQFGDRNYARNQSTTNWKASTRAEFAGGQAVRNPELLTKVRIPPLFRVLSRLCAVRFASRAHAVGGRANGWASISLGRGKPALSVRHATRKRCAPHDQPHAVGGRPTNVAWSDMRCVRGRFVASLPDLRTAHVCSGFVVVLVIGHKSN